MCLIKVNLTELKRLMNILNENTFFNFKFNLWLSIKHNY